MLTNQETELRDPGAAALPTVIGVTLGPLALEGLGGLAGSPGSLERRLVEAIRAFLASAGAPVLPNPEAVPAYEPAAAAVVSCELTPAEREALERAAKEAGATVDQLVTHAVLLYLAREDAGRGADGLVGRDWSDVA